MITKKKKVSLATKIHDHSKSLYACMMHQLVSDIVSQPATNMYSEQRVKEMMLRRARLAVSAAEAFHTNWNAVRGKFKEPAE